MCKSNENERPFTWQELSKHNTPESSFVAIRGKVYDVTEFRKRHPGGEDALLVSAGRDATQVFETYHPLRIHELLGKFQVGVLVSDELPTFPEPSPFFIAIKERVEQYFKDTNQDPKYAPWQLFRYFMIFSTIAVSWAITLSTDNLALQLFLALPMGLACALVGLMPMHDASHFSVTHNPLVWKYLGASHDFINGASYLVWLYQHTMGHHPYTNIDGADPDIVTSEKDVRRIKESQPWYSFYINQHVYVPILYAALGIKTRIQDVTILWVMKKNGDIRVNEPTSYHQTVFWAGKAFFVFYRFVLPMLLGMSFWRTVGLFVACDVVTSYWLALTFQANHVVEEVDWPVPDADGKINRDWAEHQVDTTQDYAHDSWFWNVFSGALNHQTTHHIFPGVNQYYYPQISPIIAKAAKEFNVPYHYKNTYLEAIGGHIGHLYNLGQEAKERSDAAAAASTKKAQ